jgi:hypothetical protein
MISLKNRGIYVTHPYNVLGVMQSSKLLKNIDIVLGAGKN